MTDCCAIARARANNVRLSDEEKFAILTTKEVYRPLDMSFPARMSGGQKRYFNHSWLKTYSWLVYSKHEDAGYCLPCLLFRADLTGAGQLVRIGLTNFKTASRILQGHMKEHHTCCMNHQQHRLAPRGLAKFQGLGVEIHPSICCGYAHCHGHDGTVQSLWCYYSRV